MSATRRQVRSLTPVAKVLGSAITHPAKASKCAEEKPSAKRSRPQPIKDKGDSASASREKTVSDAVDAWRNEGDPN